MPDNANPYESARADAVPQPKRGWIALLLVVGALLGGSATWVWTWRRVTAEANRARAAEMMAREALRARRAVPVRGASEHIEQAAP